MPNMDRTGPMGLGAETGLGQGACQEAEHTAAAGPSAAVAETAEHEHGRGMGCRRGAGMGRGSGMGRGAGMGRGQRCGRGAGRGAGGGRGMGRSAGAQGILSREGLLDTKALLEKGLAAVAKQLDKE